MFKSERGGMRKPWRQIQKLGSVIWLSCFFLCWVISLQVGPVNGQRFEESLYICEETLNQQAYGIAPVILDRHIDGGGSGIQFLCPCWTKEIDNIHIIVATPGIQSKCVD